MYIKQCEYIVDETTFVLYGYLINVDLQSFAFWNVSVHIHGLVQERCNVFLGLTDQYHEITISWDHDTGSNNLWPILLTWINFNPSMNSNHMLSKVWDEITYPFLNFNGCTVEV